MICIISYLEGGVGGVRKTWANVYQPNVKAEQVFGDFNKAITNRKVVIGIELR